MTVSAEERWRKFKKMKVSEGVTITQEALIDYKIIVWNEWKGRRYRSEKRRRYRW